MELKASFQGPGSIVLLMLELVSELLSIWKACLSGLSEVGSSSCTRLMHTDDEWLMDTEDEFEWFEEDSVDSATLRLRDICLARV
jgi:hypothetical protein